VLERAKRGNDPGHSKGGRRGILVRICTHLLNKTDVSQMQSQAPDIIEEIQRQLHVLQKAKAPITVVTSWAIILATILEKQPELLQKEFSDGSTFKASETFVRSWLHDAMKWSRRKATRAAHKLPKNWEDQCELAFFQIVHAIHEYKLPPSLYVNSDQTQLLYAPSDKMTWAETGAKQVELVGAEEKRALTVMVSVASDGTILPFQAIYQGLSQRSQPSCDAPRYNECKVAGFRFEHSGTATYWSNQQMMKNFVTLILHPYFKDVKKVLGRPASAKALWQIDVWSVHQSVEFREWMAKEYPYIILVYVPGGCTGVFQPCDVGIQHPFKLSVRKSYHKDIVKEVLAQEGKDTFTMDTSVGKLRNRSVRWLWNAYNVLRNPELVKKVRDEPPIFK
jgi:hypothetical protein